MNLFNPTHFAFTILLAITLGSCNRERTPAQPSLTHTLVKVSEYEIQIDSVTAANFIYYQHYREGSREYFTMLNSITQEINFYNLKTKALAFKVALEFEGPNAVGNLKGFNSGYYIHNLDSIFVLNRNRGSLFLINSRSELLKSYKTAHDRAIPSPVIAPFAPMHVKGNKALLLNIQTGMDHFGRNKEYRSDYASIIDLKHEEHEGFLSYPELYTTGAWGINLHRISWAIDRQKERLIVSYPLDDNLYEFDFKGQISSTKLARSHIKTQHKSIDKDDLSYSARKAYDVSQSKYGSIMYDDIRELHLRECIGEIAAEKYKNNPRSRAERTLVLLDSELNKIGEVPRSAPGELVMFFNEEGIHQFIQTENEDILKFEVYEVSTL